MKRTKKTTEDGKKRVLSMSDNMKERYAEMFIKALDAMEGAQWQKPWVTPNNGVPCNLYRQGKPYRKSNAFWLSMLEHAVLPYQDADEERGRTSEVQGPDG